MTFSFFDGVLVFKSIQQFANIITTWGIPVKKLYYYNIILNKIEYRDIFEGKIVIKRKSRE